MENTGFYTCPLDIIGNYWKHFQGLNLNKVSHHQKIDHSSQKHWILFVSVRLHWTPMENIFKVYPQAIHFFFCLLSVPNWSFPWKTLDSIYGHWNPSDSDSTQFWGLPSTSTWFFSKVSHSLSENWSLWLNPLDAIHVHQKISDTDGRIHIINLMTSGVINHDHSQ